MLLGVYPIPAFFRKIKMPSFWMSYIRVADIDQTVERAQALGGKIELQEDNALGRIALIRDPLGSGFTCIQTKTLGPTRGSKHGQCCWNELVISDLAKAQAFYSGLFGWTFEPDSDDRHIIRNAESRAVGSIQVAPNAIKGEKEYWAVSFAVKDLSAAKRAVEQAGGAVVYEYANALGSHLIVHDDQGAAFTLTALTDDTSYYAASHTTTHQHLNNSIKWRAIVGLIGVYLIVLLEQDWAWGLLFLYWVVPDLKTGVTYFIQAVDRRHSPATYWAIVGTWLAMSAYLLIEAIL